MDEPLGALDKKLREALQLEVMHISRQLGATVIYVTHDQEEALVMSDRIAIFSRGRIEQLGRGDDLYDRPVSLFVADFIGESNILRGHLERDADARWLSRDGVRWRVGAAQAERMAIADGSPAALVIRPERLRITGADGAAGASGLNAVEATVRDALYLGPTRKYELTLVDGQPVSVRRQADSDERAWQAGDRVRLLWAVDDAVLVADPGG
jgi:putative spermidine/putrescine transport system ATP-binding protein